MRSIKPGRGPSALGGIGSIGAAVFGVFWTIQALAMGAPPLFAGFGVLFVVMAIVTAVYNYKNATSKNRMSLYDITTENEEPDPIDYYIKTRQEDRNTTASTNLRQEYSSYCPYCGKGLKDDFTYCPQCGKHIKG